MSDDIVKRLRNWSDNAKEQGVSEVVEGLTAAADEIERLRKERDEARRKICYDESYNHKSGVTPREVAEDHEWDCFKETR